MSAPLSASRRASRCVSALRRACALGGAALALLAPSAQAQDAAALAPPAFTQQTIPTGLNNLVYAPAVADLDGDGDLDVLYVDASPSGPSFYVHLNTAGPGAAPVFATRVRRPFGLADVGGVGGFANAADLDGDGDLDVLVGGGSDFLYYENTAGPGGFPLFGPRQSSPFGLANPPSNQGFPSPSVADLDGDGDMDVLAGARDGNYYYFQNTAGPGSTPAFAGPTINQFGLTNLGLFNYPRLVDLDGDGDLDVLSALSQGGYRYFQNTAGPRATPVFAAVANQFGLSSTSANLNIATADLDGDGDLDVLASTDQGLLYYTNSADPEAITARLSGTDGYRMLAAPSAATTIGGLLGTTIYTQGFPGATATGGQSTVLRYDETVPGTLDMGYAAPGNLSDAAGLGRGLFVYVFADQDPRPSAPGVQGGFPKTLTATGRRPLIDFDWGGATPDAPLTFTDSPASNDNDGWNLLGNPFGTAFDWDGTTLVGVNAPVYAYDNATAAYRSHTRGIPAAGNLTGGMIAPFQGFWVQTNAAAPSIRARAATTNGGVLYREAADRQTVVGLRLSPGAGSALPAGVQSETFLALGVDGAAVGADAFDALALVPPAQSYVLLGTSEASADPARVLAIDARPAAAGVVTVGLDVSAVVNGAAAGTDLVLDWPALDLPDGWQARLLDAATGAIVEMTAGGSYPFALAGPAPRAAGDALAVPALGDAPELAEARLAGRFTLVVTPRGATAGEADAPGATALSAARPNPTTGTSSLTLTLAEAADVRVAVYDVLGREVAVLAEGAMAAGDVPVRVAAGALAPGTYVVRAAVGGRVLVQRLTVTR